MQDEKCCLLHALMNNLAIILGECELLEVEGHGGESPRLAIIRERAGHMADLVRHYDCPVEYQPTHDGLFKSLVRAAKSRVTTQ